MRRWDDEAHSSSSRVAVRAATRRHSTGRKEKRTMKELFWFVAAIVLLFAGIIFVPIGAIAWIVNL